MKIGLRAAGKSLLFAVLIRPAATSAYDQESVAFSKNLTQYLVKESREEYVGEDYLVNAGQNKFLSRAEDEGADECKKCVGSIGKIVIEKVMKKVDHYCEKPSPCPKQKKFCAFYKKHPQIVTGMMWFWVRPMMDGYLFCLGKGSCKPKEFDIDNPEHVSELGMEEINLMEHAAKELELNDFVPSTQEAFEIQMRVRMQTDEDPMDEALAEIGDFGIQSFEGPKPSRACMEKVMKHIMIMVIKKFIGWCRDDKAKCPVRKKVCDWADHHRDFTGGYLLALVEPWKYAEGYCFKRKIKKEAARLIHEAEEIALLEPPHKLFKGKGFSPYSKGFPQKLRARFIAPPAEEIPQDETNDTNDTNETILE